MLDYLSDISELSSTANRELPQNMSQSELEIVNVDNSENHIFESIKHSTVTDITNHQRQENEQPQLLPIIISNYQILI